MGTSVLFFAKSCMFPIAGLEMFHNVNWKTSKTKLKVDNSEELDLLLAKVRQMIPLGTYLILIIFQLDERQLW